MKNRNWKWYSFLLALVIALFGIMVLSGCGGSNDNATVRQPEGDVETFWDSFDWAELNPAEQATWAVLGWDEASWTGDAGEPASENKDWAELTADEQAAATKLGYTQSLWDATE